MTFVVSINYDSHYKDVNKQLPQRQGSKVDTQYGTGRIRAGQEGVRGVASHRVTQHTGQQLYVPSEGQSIMVKYLAFNRHRCHTRDSNPHSTDQKHQSLSPVLLTAGPRHTTGIYRVRGNNVL